MRRLMTPDLPPGPREGTYFAPDVRPPRGKAAGPAADGGFRVDSDLHQMSYEGRSSDPTPALWADPDWRDNLGEWDTFDDAESAGRPLTP